MDCFGCKYHTPNGECYIGTIENCILRKGDKTMFDYLFIDNVSGEEFFVECDTLKEAWGIVCENFGPENECEYLGRYSVEEAEILGYDTY